MSRRTILVFAVVLAAVLAPTALAQTPEPATPSGTAASDPSANYEINFLKDMSNHHAAAVIMAQQCVKDAKHEELRTFCQQLVNNQNPEIEQMVTALANWYGIVGYKPDAMAPMSDMGAMIDTMNTMTNTMGTTGTVGATGDMGEMGMK